MDTPTWIALGGLGVSILVSVITGIWAVSFLIGKIRTDVAVIRAEMCTKDEAHKIAEEKVNAYALQQKQKQDAYDLGKRDGMNTPAHGLKGVSDGSD